MLLGRGRVNMISTQIYQSSSGVSGANWPLAASLSILSAIKPYLPHHSVCGPAPGGSRSPGHASREKPQASKRPTVRTWLSPASLCLHRCIRL